MDDIMGVHVCLEVWWHAIEPAAWAEVYDDCLSLLRAHPSELLGYARRELLGQDVVMYTKDIEDHRGGERSFCVVGDRRSMRLAESFRMPRAHPGRRGPRAAIHAGPEVGGAMDGDIVLDDPEARSGARVFGARTQAEPYHVPIVAAALVVEARFPGAALVSGDVDEDDAREAKQWAEDVLGREIALPVLLDAPALLRRLSRRWTGEALIRAFQRRFLGDAAQGLSQALGAVDRASAEAYVRRQLGRGGGSARDGSGLDSSLGRVATPGLRAGDKARNSSGAGSSSGMAATPGLRAGDKARDGGCSGPGPLDVVRAWLRATGDVARLCALAALPAERMAETLASAGVLLPPALRRRIERCSKVPLPARPDVSLLGALMSAIFLHQGWSAPVIEPGALEAALAGAYPGREAEILARMRERSRRIEEILTGACERIEEAECFVAGLEPYQDLGELVAARSAEELVPLSRRRLAAFARALRAVRSVGGPAWEEHLADSRAVHGLLVRLGGQHGPTLTEHAWDWILREEEPAVLGVLIPLFCCRPDGEEGFRLRRAALENRVVCAEIARMIEDDCAMEEGKALLERSKVRKRSSRD